MLSELRMTIYLGEGEAEAGRGVLQDCAHVHGLHWSTAHTGVLSFYSVHRLHFSFLCKYTVETHTQNKVFKDAKISSKKFFLEEIF